MINNYTLIDLDLDKLKDPVKHLAQITKGFKWVYGYIWACMFTFEPMWITENSAHNECI